MGLWKPGIFLPVFLDVLCWPVSTMHRWHSAFLDISVHCLFQLPSLVFIWLWLVLAFTDVDLWLMVHFDWLTLLLLLLLHISGDWLDRGVIEGPNWLVIWLTSLLMEVTDWAASGD